jgi:hypothetical protein
MRPVPTSANRLIPRSPKCPQLAGCTAASDERPPLPLTAHGARRRQCAGRIVNDNEPCGHTMIINNFGPIKSVDHSIAELAAYHDLAAYYDGLAMQAERSGRYRVSLAYAQTAAELRRLSATDARGTGAPRA